MRSGSVASSWSIACEPLVPVPLVGFELALLVVVEVEQELRVSDTSPAVSATRFFCSSRIVLIAVASCSARLASGDPGPLGELPPSLLQVRQQLLDVAARRPRGASPGSRDRRPCRPVGSRAVSSRSSVFSLGLAAVGAQGASCAWLELDPAGRDRDQFLVQPGGPGP